MYLAILRSKKNIITKYYYQIISTHCLIIPSPLKILTLFFFRTAKQNVKETLPKMNQNFSEFFPPVVSFQFYSRINRESFEPSGQCIESFLCFVYLYNIIFFINNMSSSTVIPSASYDVNTNLHTLSRFRITFLNRNSHMSSPSKE